MALLLKLNTQFGQANSGSVRLELENPNNLR